ncbi:30S ribosomal protein S13 [Thermococci archaeon]|nr:MAG: 30S ribosomal protein S13 [Thermococci archaeon]
MEGREYRAIIRIAGTDCDGSRRIDHGLRTIKGVGLNMARAVVKAAGLPLNMRLGYLTDEEVEKIEKILENPIQYGIPEWMLNRQRDPEMGISRHIIGSDWDITVRFDIEKMKRIKSWKGVRHALGLKVRGQRTRTTGRKGKTVGVVRKRRG